VGNKLPVVEVSGLRTRLKSRNGEIDAVDNVSFQLQRNERMALVGESGSGKTITALSIMSLLPVNGRVVSGDIKINGRSVIGLKLSELRRMRGRDISMVFQEPMMSLNPVHTIGKQLVEAIRLHQDLAVETARSLAAELLDRVQIPDARNRLKDYPHQFSGGMCQRVMIAMALANRPSVIIADEPTTALDVTTQAQILALLDEICIEDKMSVIFISHDLSVVASFCDRVAVMYAGRLIEYGPAEKVFEAPRHPYTKGLIGSMPPIDHDVDELLPIPGEPPDLFQLDPGCTFAPRCNFKESRCLKSRPELELVFPGHYCACICWDRLNPS